MLKREVLNGNSTEPYYLIFSEDENIEIDEKAPSMGAKTLCIPFNQPEGLVAGVTKCFACSDNALSYTLWGRSY